MSGPPNGWELAELSDLCDFNPKHPPDTPRDKVVSFVPMASVGEISGEIEAREDRELSEIWKGYTHFQDGDVIFAKITPCMENGKAAIAKNLTGGMACGSTEFHVLRPSDGLMPEFLWRFLRQKSFRRDAERAMTGAVGQRRVPADYLRATSLSVPPLAEQRRIVAKIDSLFAKTKRAREELGHVPRLIEHYKQAILAAAIFRAREISRAISNESEAEVVLSSICTSITDGDHQAPPRTASGIPFITISAMNDGKIDLEKATRFVPITYYENLRETRRPQLGDVLFSVTGSIAIPAIVKDREPFVFQRHIAVLRPDPEKVRTEYLALLLKSDHIRQQAHAVATGTAQLTVPLTGLRNFGAAVPPLDAQDKIVADVDAAFSWIDRIAHDHACATHLLDRLDQSILSKALRGQLVPQDPNDEPASMLLERIRAERTSQPKAKRRGRKQKAA